MNRVSKFFMSEIQRKEGIISIDPEDFIGFSDKVNIITIKQNYKLKEWLKKKKLKVKKLIICVFLPTRDIPGLNIEWISKIVSKFVSVEKPIFGIYKNYNQKGIKITLIYE